MFIIKDKAVCMRCGHDRFAYCYEYLECLECGYESDRVNVSNGKYIIHVGVKMSKGINPLVQKKRSKRKCKNYIIECEKTDCNICPYLTKNTAL